MYKKKLAPAVPGPDPAKPLFRGYKEFNLGELEENARLNLGSDISEGGASTVSKITQVEFLVSPEQGFSRVRSRHCRGELLLVHLQEILHTDNVVSVQVTLTIQV